MHHTLWLFIKIGDSINDCSTNLVRVVAYYLRTCYLDSEIPSLFEPIDCLRGNDFLALF